MVKKRILSNKELKIMRVTMDALEKDLPFKLDNRTRKLIVNTVKETKKNIGSLVVGVANPTGTHIVPCVSIWHEGVDPKKVKKLMKKMGAKTYTMKKSV